MLLDADSQVILPKKLPESEKLDYLGELPGPSAMATIQSTFAALI